MAHDRYGHYDDQVRETDPTADDGALTVDFARWQSGDAKAFERLLEALLPGLRERAHRRLGAGLRNLIETQDAVQDTLATFLDNPELQAANDLQHLENLLGAMVENTLRGHHRHQHQQRRDVDRNQCAAAEPELGNTTTTPSRVAVRHEEGDALRDAVSSLAEIDQRIVNARSAGASFADISEVVGISAEAARKRYVRAFDTLRQKLRGDQSR